MNNTVILDFEEVIQRLKKKLGEKSDRALARALSMSDSGVAVARKSQSLPIIPIVNTCIEQEISLDEIFLGNTKRESSNLTNTMFTQAELIHVSNMVDGVLERVLENKKLPIDRQFSIFKTLRPHLIEAAFANNLDEMIVKAIAEATLRLV
ncbi:helix-turn-helix domain-containing protein [Aliikangiella maris]|uniref:Helix-turn-helix domain-containing protein n=2 Tax=Aliikangiella maris TaxID=3162458 RepID=A0ABV2BSE7_9GAMM